MSPPARTISSGEGNRREPSRLQRRAPPLKINPAPVGLWNVAIPLLSPLAASPTAAEAFFSVPPPHSKTPEMEDAVVEKTPVFKNWQHPAAPFYYETAPFVPPFIPV